jgi:KDO2-lipid IV(A) lauroyltransferase
MQRARIYKLGAGILGSLPLPVLQIMGTVAGLLIWFLSSKTSNVLKTNISLAFPELSPAEKIQLAKATSVETGKMIFENLYVWSHSQQVCLEHIIEVEGLANAQAALDQGKGLILILPHIGNWELLNHFLGDQFALVHMHQPASNPAIDQLIQGFRERTGTQFTPVGTVGIRRQLSTLKNGATIGLMPDQEPDINTGEFAKFFGIDCLTGELAGKLATKTGAKLMTVSCLRREPYGSNRGQFRIVFSEIETGRSEISVPQLINFAIERIVRLAPTQYLWSYKRFRTRPLGQQELYTKKQHPISKTTHYLFARLGLKVASFFPIDVLQKVAEWVATGRSFLNTSKVRITRKNLQLCAQGLGQPTDDLLPLCTVEATKKLFETGLLWKCDDDEFDMHCLSVEGLEYIPERNSAKGVLVLTPAVGHPEVLMRYLGRHFKCADYYQPHNREAIDKLIRKQRAAMGIALLSRSLEGEQTLAARLLAGDVVTFSPDQQPRLRGGEFVPFFGEPALTDKTLARLIRDTNPCLVFGAAIRESRGFRLHLEGCELDTNMSDTRILTAINAHLEKIICSYPEQYEWEEKRFNIRPRGSAKIY